MRMLSRLQFHVAQVRNAGRGYIPGTESHPQGELFSAWQYGPKKYKPDLDVVESARRRMAGEANPAAPWRTPMLQHHFLGHDNKGQPRKPPEQQSLL